MAENKCFIYVAAAASIVTVVLIVILVPLSFSGVEYYEFGFKRQKSTGTVDTKQVYSGGKHFIGPDYEFKIFKATAHYVDLRDVTVFTSDKLEIKLDVQYQYFLREEDLPTLHRNYDLFYDNVVKTSAIDALKGEAPKFSTREYITNRNAIETALYNGVRERLGGICCLQSCSLYEFACPPGCKNSSSCDPSTDKGLWVNVKYFQLGAVEIPSDVEDRFLRSLTLKEDADREKLLQEAQVVRKTTEAMVRDIQNQATEILQEAQVQSELIGTISTANFTANVEKARAEGLKNLYQQLGLTTQEMKNSFDYLRTLRLLENVHFTVDFQQRIVGNFK
ncbi:hypothetical protein C0Q70_02014 [Pomacea canaliculata]|uniref:Band 7 domain-containing protein n=1 Tax=Pomacea canaliculata TaxID=400727 RepID=A0A2T7Q130_POMCA|nr:uncharacterized protein LOC112562367 [Pomacea canaliculata]XP_025091403.1 uncharacterized protein LOC112562367 [Pomacea canaliculata]PVD39384.1 hypothetical protein C0Q70_02014 [Pomacea canaliculata]